MPKPLPNGVSSDVHSAARSAYSPLSAFAASANRFRGTATDITVEGADVLVVEDIVDSGVTLNYLLQVLSQRKPRSIRIAALLDKPERRQRPVEVSYVGFRIPDEFVVGYGLDYAERYRNLPDICVVPRESA